MAIALIRYYYLPINIDICILLLTHTATYYIIYSRYVLQREQSSASYDTRRILHNQSDSGEASGPSRYCIQVDSQWRSRSLSGNARVSNQSQRPQSISSIAQNEGASEEIKNAGSYQRYNLLAVRPLFMDWTPANNGPLSTCSDTIIHIMRKVARCVYSSTVADVGEHVL